MSEEGYLQIKIRDLKIKIEEYEKQVDEVSKNLKESSNSFRESQKFFIDLNNKIEDINNQMNIISNDIKIEARKEVSNDFIEFKNWVISLIKEEAKSNREVVLKVNREYYLDIANNLKEGIERLDERIDNLIIMLNERGITNISKTVVDLNKNKIIKLKEKFMKGELK